MVGLKQKENCETKRDKRPPSYMGGAKMAKIFATKAFSMVLCYVILFMGAPVTSSETPSAVDSIDIDFIYIVDQDYSAHEDGESFSIKASPNETIQLFAEAYDKQYQSPLKGVSFSWDSSNEKVATIDNQGLVTVVNEGTTYITALTVDGDAFQSCIVELTIVPEIREAVVSVGDRSQRIRLWDYYNVLPDVVDFSVEYVDDSHNDYNFFVNFVDKTTKEIEVQRFYNLTLTSGGQPLTDLDGFVEVWFEILDDIPCPEDGLIFRMRDWFSASRVEKGEDVQLPLYTYTDDEGTSWLRMTTDHFSPYSLTDFLSDEEKAEREKSNNLPTQITVAIICIVLVCALGIIVLKLKKARKS